MKVLKFGGTSVGTYKGLENVIKIIEDYKSKNINFCVVCSAFASVTDILNKTAVLASANDEKYLTEYKLLLELHNSQIDKFIPAKSILFEAKINSYFSKLLQILQGVSLIQELSIRTLDKILSFGEILSCTIITEILNVNGIDAVFTDSRNLIKTNSDFGKANVYYTDSNVNIKNYFESLKKISIFTGFIASNHKNETTTLGRGGSDLTASILGAALCAKEIEIWTDVDGIMTADPKKVKNSMPIKAVTYEEAMEMSYYGAKVIYSPTILPALNKNIKIRVKNTFNPKFKGTVILPKENGINFSYKSISSIKEVSSIRIIIKNNLNSKGLEYKILLELNENKINILLLSQASSQKGICIAINESDKQKSIDIIKNILKDEINYLEGVIVKDNLAIIVIIGEDINKTPAASGKVFTALGNYNINIEAIVQGASDTNISLLIDSAKEQNALNILHNTLFGSLKI